MNIDECPQCQEARRRGITDTLEALERMRHVHQFYVRWVVGNHGYENAKDVSRAAEEFADEQMKVGRQ